MPSSHRSRFSLSNKIALGVIVIVAIAGFLYYAPDSIPLGDLKSLGSGIGGIMVGDETGSDDKLIFTITSSDTLLEETLSLRNVTVTAEGTHKSATSIGEAVFDNADKEADITFEGFEGTAILENTLSIDGKATSAISGGATIKPKSDSFSVEAELSPTSYSIGTLNIQNLDLEGVSGSIERLGKESSTIQLVDSALEISNFEGILTLSDGQYKLTGSARRIEGESFTLSA